MTGLNSVRKYEEKVWDRKHSKGRVITGLNSVRKYEEKVWDRKHSKDRVMTGLNSVRKYEEKVWDRKHSTRQNYYWSQENQDQRGRRLCSHFPSLRINIKPTQETSESANQKNYGILAKHV